MFNSQKINTDPKSWHEYETDTRYTPEEVRAHNARGRCWYGLAHDPRPEFDNRPNPLLVAFREAVEHSASGATVPEIARDWLGQGWPKFLTEQETAHAARVLARLAALT